ncbi:hypothetical protein Tco_0869350 [Tanacetum coccineum]
MVAFLQKPEGSAGFHQIVDFFNSTYIKYALTKNPIIYVSLIHQFWETASSSTSENGEMETTATIDGESSFDCDFVSLDPIINSRKYTIKNSFTLGSTEEADKVTILQSCNGLLLCTGSRRHAFNYVYNPSTNLLKILSEPDYVNVDSNVYGCAGLRLAFDPTKSPYYKVGNYSIRVVLLLVRRDDFVSSKFTIYEMMKGSSVWSVRYHVDTDDFMTPLPEGWLIRPTVWSIVLVEMEDDSFLVINLSRKVVEYNNNNSQETWEKV